VRRVLFWLLTSDVVTVIVLLLLGKKSGLPSFEIAFISSTLIVSASMLSYARMVKNRLQVSDIPLDDDRDILEKLDDPHDLYSDDIKPSSKELKEAIKEEKQRVKDKKRGLSQTIKDSKASFSFYRLGAYLILFLGFIYLKNNHLLQISSYIIGITVPIIAIVISLMMKRGVHK